MSNPTPTLDQTPQHHTDHPSVGPVIGVLAVITVLGALAVMVGRICSGRRIMGRVQYDFETWFETKCGTCIDGRVYPPQNRARVGSTAGETVPPPAPPQERGPGPEPERGEPVHQQQEEKAES